MPTETTKWAGDISDSALIENKLPYLIEASKNIENIYDPFSSSIKSAPIETHHYLASAYHIAGQLDEAEENYQRFLDVAGKNHILRPAAEKGLEMCQVARELMADPVDVQITNIGTPINSEYAEYSPIVAFDENALYYTSRRLRTDGSNSSDIEIETGLYYEDMYVSFKNLQGGWMNPELLNINIPNAHSSVVSMSHDGQRLYTYKSYRGNGNIYESKFEIGTGWSTPQPLGSDINSKDNEFFATLSADGQRLYFVSDRPGGLGGKDIWYCNKLPTGEWGKSINIGAPINTAFDEDAPFIHPNGKTMYFSSNGHRSMGGYDIFSTRWNGREWSSPVNLGYPINTTDDDHSYITIPSGRRAYYSSKGSGSLGSTDIYVVEYPEESPAPEIDMSGFAVLKGWVLTGQDSLPSAFRIYLTQQSSGEQAGEATPVARNGSFVFIIPSGASYTIDYTLGDDTLITEHISIGAGEQYKELKREIILSPNKNGSMEAIVLDESVLNPLKSGRISIGKQGIIPIGSKIFYVDEQDQVLHTVYVSKDGFFAFKELTSNQPVILKAEVPGIGPNEVRIALKNNDDTTIELFPLEDRFVTADRLPQEALKQSPQPKTDSTQTQDKVEAYGEHTATLSEKTYRFTFDYNILEINTSSEDYQALLSAIRSTIEESQTPVTLRIEGSASKVPTQRFDSNEALAELRAKTAQKQLISSLKSTGLDTNKMLTFELRSSVNGPAYNDQTRGQKDLFIDYQNVTFYLN